MTFVIQRVGLACEHFGVSHPKKKSSVKKKPRSLSSVHNYPIITPVSSGNGIVSIDVSNYVNQSTKTVFKDIPDSESDNVIVEVEDNLSDISDEISISYSESGESVESEAEQDLDTSSDYTQETGSLEGDYDIEESPPRYRTRRRIVNRPGQYQIAERQGGFQIINPGLFVMNVETDDTFKIAELFGESDY